MSVQAIAWRTPPPVALARTELRWVVRTRWRIQGGWGPPLLAVPNLEAVFRTRRLAREHARTLRAGMRNQVAATPVRVRVTIEEVG